MARRSNEERDGAQGAARRDLPSNTDAADWRERTLEAVAADQESAKVVVSRRRPAQALLQFDIGFAQLLTEAAQARDISVAGYGRRAIARQIAADLGIDWTEVLAFCPEPTAYGKRMVGRRERTVDDGKGFGDWNN